MSKHTPGPWKCEENKSTFGIYSKTLGGDHRPTTVCVVQKQSPSAKARADANIRLICAAPELLKASRIAHGVLTRQLDDEAFGDDEHEALAVLEDAIAKAEATP